MLTAGLARLDAQRARLGDDEAGQGMVEYSLVLMLVAIVVIVVVLLLGHRVSNLYSNVSNGLAQ